MRRTLLLLLFSVCLAASDRPSEDRGGVTARARGLPLSERSVASRIGLQPGVTQPLISGAYSSTLLLKPDGTVWSWGANGYGQLGDGTTTGRLQPVNTAVLTDVRFLSGGHGNTSTFGLAVTGSGAVYSWGANSAGQLGDGTTTPHATPAVVPNLTGAIQAKAGEYYSTVLKGDGTVWSWGSNGFGQLGNGGYTSTTTPGQVSNMTGVTAISSWSAFTLALKSDGTVWGWGTDYSGELGDGATNTNRPLPVQTLNLTNVRAIANGWIHGLAVKSDGTLWAWGRNLNGQLGDGTFTNRSVPAQVSGLTSVTAAAGGENHSLALKSDGTVWAWGDNSRGELGDGTTTSRTTPVQASGLSNIVAIAAGTNFSVAVSTDGIVYGWGANDAGQIGDWTTTDRVTATPISDIGYAWRAGPPILSVAAGTYTTVQTVAITNPQSGVDMHYTVTGSEPTATDPAVAAGGTLTIDVSETLKVAAWKTGFARSNTTSAVYTLQAVTPTFSPAPGTFTTAQSVTIATTTTGATIRYTTDGTTPTGTSTAYTAPVTVNTTTTLNAIAFTTGWSPSSVASGTYTMNFGTLPAPTISPATGTYTNSADVTVSTIAGATLRYTLDGTDPTTASTLYTGSFSVMTSSTLKVKAWHPDYAPSAVASAAYTIVVATPTLTPGAGTYPAGQVITVGTASPGTTVTYTLNGVDPVDTDPSMPAGGTLIAGNYTLKAKAWRTGATPSPVSTATYTVTGELVAPIVTGGLYTGFGVRSDGAVWGWGQNGFGCVGDGTTAVRVNPVPLVGVTGVRYMAGGSYHSVALIADGTVKAWGLNASGEIGDGTITNRSMPTAVTGLTDATALAVGVSHTLALRAGGTLVAWGYNAAGQLGDGSTTNRFVPVAVSGLTGVTAISAGSDHNVALKSDGTVWSWGDNAQGQLGDGTNTRRVTPVQVSGLTGVIYVQAGNGSSLAIKSDGTVWTWGWNFYGQLGDGTGTNRLTPVQMSGITNAVAGGFGWEHAVVLRNDGTVWSVGRNTYGQLGTPGGDRSTVAQVSGLPAIARLHVAAYTNYVVTTDAAAWAWGRNSNQTIGDGTSIDRSAAVPIAGPGLVWRPWMPAISVASGQYATEQNPVVANSDPSAVMHYATTGFDPTESDPVVNAGASVAVTQSLTLKVRSFKTGAPPSEIVAAAYTLKVIAPSPSPAAGTYASAQSVTLSTATSSATIRYTLDGRTPTPYSSAYSTPVSIGVSTTLKTFATRTGWTSSDLVSATYWIAPATTLVAPTISPAAGSYETARVIAITPAEAGASARYTLDGTDPTAQSPLFVRGFLVGYTTTVKARSFKPGYAAGPIATATFTMQFPGVSDSPTLSPLGGRSTTMRVVTITGPAGATLRYTTTGIDPTDTDTTISSGSTVTVDRSMVLKVRAWQTGLVQGVVRREDYIITGMISAGEAHSIALKADGTVWTWGDDYWAQIGDGGSATRTAPYQALSGAIAVAAGFHHNLVLKADGTVWAWGHNYAGEVGDGTTTMRRSPVQVPGLTNVIAVAGSVYTSYAIKADGTLWAWGANWHGQLGDGTTTNRLSPIQVPGLTGVQAVAAGDSFALAIVSHGAANGGLWAWGLNSVGQLGNGTTTGSLTPQPVATATAVTSIAAGANFALARTADKELLMWGSNDSGQQGNGGRTDGYTNADNLLPVRTGPWMGPLAEIAAGHHHALALGQDGQLWGWGRSCEFQLAMSATCEYRLTVEPIAAFTTAASISGGASHTIAVDRNGRVWAWGHNGQGQMGDGTLTWRAVPVQVTGLQLVENAFLAGDQDGDGLTTWTEYQLGLDPLSADTSGLGVRDSLSSAPNLDPDGDGLSNAIEAILGTDPYNPDTDGDGVPDGIDAYPLDPTRWQRPAPDPLDHTPPVITLIYPTNARPVGGGL